MSEINSLDMHPVAGKLSFQLVASLLIDFLPIFLFVMFPLMLALISVWVYALVRIYWVHVLMEDLHGHKMTLILTIVVSVIPIVNLFPIATIVWMYRTLRWW